MIFVPLSLRLSSHRITAIMYVRVCICVRCLIYIFGKMKMTNHIWKMCECMFDIPCAHIDVNISCIDIGICVRIWFAFEC